MQASPEGHEVLSRQWRVVGAAACVAVVVMGGCKTAQEYREDADGVARKIITEGQEAALGHAEPFTIERPADTLRRRLMESQDLPRSGPGSLGTDELEPTDHWPDDNYLETRKDVVEPPVVDWKGEGPVKLGLVEVLQIGARNSREYQSRKEAVFETALSLDLRRNEFRLLYSGLVNGTLVPDFADETVDTSTTFSAGLTKQFENGLSLSSRIFFDVAQLLTQDGTNSLGFVGDVSVTLPLLAGSGKHIVREPLTQAERNVITALWDFERYKKTFAVQVASQYLGIVQRLDEVQNAERNYIQRIKTTERVRALMEQQQVAPIDVDQSEQDVLSARVRWIQSQESYQASLDQFKQTLGLPVDAEIELDAEELTRLAAAATARLGGENDGTGGSMGYHLLDDDTIVLENVSKEGGGPLEMDYRTAIELAFDNRLDLKEVRSSLEDAQRGVVIAADALRPGLNLTASGTVGQRRGVGSSDLPDARIESENGSYSAGFTFSFPWEKTAERRAYRVALIDLETSVRNLQAKEDEIKRDVRNALRNLLLSRENYRIQAAAVKLAARRVDAAWDFYDLGQRPIRDWQDAQDSLFSAQDALTGALVDYRITELELQRDMGVLEVDSKGLWKEYQPK